MPASSPPFRTAFLVKSGFDCLHFLKDNRFQILSVVGKVLKELLPNPAITFLPLLTNAPLPPEPILLMIGDRVL